MSDRSGREQDLAVERELEERFARLGARGFRVVPCAEALIIRRVPGANRCLPAPREEKSR